MDALIKWLPAVLRAGGSSPEVAEAAALAAWKHAIGEGLQSHAIATGLESNTLIIEVRDAIWRRQLATMKDQLLFRVNSLLGQALVSNLELRVNPEAVIVTRENNQEPVELIDNEVPAELMSAASAIRDQQLRRKFLSAAVTTLKRNPQ